jgi:hypothetical protein
MHVSFATKMQLQIKWLICRFLVMYARNKNIGFAFKAFYL